MRKTSKRHSLKETAYKILFEQDEEGGFWVNPDEYYGEVDNQQLHLSN